MSIEEPKIIVAHRGLSELYPENTALSIERAIMVGAKAIEFDVQMSADKVPVVFHDINLERITSHQGMLPEMLWSEIQQLPASYPSRFADRFTDVRISSLSSIATLLSVYPGRVPVIEIKSESLQWFDCMTYIKAVLKAAEPVLNRALLISFDDEIIRCLHAVGISRTGFILNRYDQHHRQLAEKLKPKLIICDLKQLPCEDVPLWTGEWEWMVYKSEDPAVIQNCFARGIRYVETDNVEKVARLLPQYFYDPIDKTRV